MAKYTNGTQALIVAINDSENKRIAHEMLGAMRGSDLLVVLALSSVIGKLIANSAVHTGFSSFIMNCMTNSELSFSHWKQKTRLQFERQGQAQQEAFRMEAIRKMYNDFMNYRIVPQQAEDEAARPNAHLMRLFAERSIGSDTFCLKKEGAPFTVEHKLEEFKRIFKSSVDFENRVLYNDLTLNKICVVADENTEAHILNETVKTLLHVKEQRERGKRLPIPSSNAFEVLVVSREQPLCIMDTQQGVEWLHLGKISQLNSESASARSKKLNDEDVTTTQDTPEVVLPAENMFSGTGELDFVVEENPTKSHKKFNDYDIVVVFVNPWDGEDLESLHTIINKQYKVYGAKRVLIVTDVLPMIEEQIDSYSKLYRRGSIIPCPKAFIIS